MVTYAPTLVHACCDPCSSQSGESLVVISLVCNPVGTFLQFISISSSFLSVILSYHSPYLSCQRQEAPEVGKVLGGALRSHGQPRPTTRRSSSQSGNPASPETHQDTQLDLSSLTVDALVGLIQSQISLLDQTRTESSQAPPLPGRPSPGTSTVSSALLHTSGQGPPIRKKLTSCFAA